MNIVLACATHRGYLFLERLLALAPEAHVHVFSFREEPVEPPFLDKIRALAHSRGAGFQEARQLGAPELGPFWASTSVDLLFAISWRYLIPKAVYSAAKLGSFVIHDSLLPAYRGFSPTVWSIINGEARTGATLFAMEEDVDSGDIVAQSEVPIGESDTIATVMERVTQAYLSLLEDNLPSLLSGTTRLRPQDQSKISFACKRTAADNLIDWRRSSVQIYNLVRAVTRPYGGALTFLDGQPLRVWSAAYDGRRRYVGRVPGRILDLFSGEGVLVGTGDGSLLLNEVQLGDQPAVRADLLLRGRSITLGGSSARLSNPV
jgi:methionyl-tRNA formyltransferase